MNEESSISDWWLIDVLSEAVKWMMQSKVSSGRDGDLDCNGLV